jgi:hypothetical protein
MPNCDHVGPEQVIEYAEHALRERGLPPEQWDGARYAWSGNVDEKTSVHVEVVRENDGWRVTQLERRKSAIPESESGYRTLA